MQRQSTYNIRNIAHNVLLQKGQMTLSDLEKLTAISKNKLRYAIDSTSPFGALFSREYICGAYEYNAIPIDEIYGGNDF